MKLTTWNIKHLGKILSDLTNPSNAERLKRISDEITRIDPDILCINEAPADIKALRNWISRPVNQGGLNGAYEVPTIAGTEEILNSNPPNIRKALQDLYGMQGTDITGNQWIWFLTKSNSFEIVELQDPKVWQGLTGRKSWPVNYWGKYDSKKANHWRHPQVLVVEKDNKSFEVIGVHLKSKINKKSAFDQNKNLKQGYVDEALRARIKLATEANDVRRYIDQRFLQEENPYIIICGDANDGPGREFFERQYLFFDLISNLQGDIFFAHRFFNHALFDYPERLRWSTKFNDRLERWAREKFGTYNRPTPAFDNTKKQLIDHVLFSQAFSDETNGLFIKSKSGLIEHTIHEKINASLSASKETSDHRPVSIHIHSA